MNLILPLVVQTKTTRRRGSLSTETTLLVYDRRDKCRIREKKHVAFVVVVVVVVVGLASLTTEESVCHITQTLK